MIPTSFNVVYNSFLSKITDDMYLELTKQDTEMMLQELLLGAIPKFEFPRVSLDYITISPQELCVNCKNKALCFGEEDLEESYPIFVSALNLEQIDVLSTYMIVEWLGQQLASIENTRMKYSGSDFKFTSQANHMQKLLALQKDYERKGFHLQRLYKRRIKDTRGVYRSTIHTIMEQSEAYTALERGEVLFSSCPFYEQVVIDPDDGDGG